MIYMFSGFLNLNKQQKTDNERNIDVSLPVHALFNLDWGPWFRSSFRSFQNIMKNYNHL